MKKSFAMSFSMTTALSWSELEILAADFTLDRVNGPTNAQSRLRLFGQTEADVRVTLYRDHHAWCPYCQKIWLWLEEKQIPYQIEKVTMFCYGQKESWYKQIVPSGMLPAIKLNDRLITESDDILLALEATFGALTFSMEDPRVLTRRRLERLLFRAWCNWLCYPTSSARDEQQRRSKFSEIMQLVEEALAETTGSYFLEEFSTADVIFTPYVERMNASLYYYKGYSMREVNPRFRAWCDAMETRSTYRGTQSDFHTHAHDLPPQMGGCYSNGTEPALINQTKVDRGPWFELPDVAYPEPENSHIEALHRVVQHRHNIIRVNPIAEPTFDQALRCALTLLIKNEICPPPQGTDVGLRYLRDRISVPRDMSIYAAKRLRQALETTAALVGDSQGSPIPINHRRDQDPMNFVGRS
jgi:glutathione S-transferase